MTASAILVSKETMCDFFPTMAQVKATGALLRLVLKERKIIYSNAGIKIGSTKLTEKSKLCISDVEGDFNYLSKI